MNCIWEAKRAALFDNRIINTDANSYISQEWFTIARNIAL